MIRWLFKLCGYKYRKSGVFGGKGVFIQIRKIQKKPKA